MAIDVNSFIQSYPYAAALRSGSAYPSAVRRVSPVAAEEASRAQSQQNVAVESDAGKGGRSGGFLRQHYASEERALAQLLPVRATLDPSDEVALFGQEGEGVTALPLREITRAGEATDSNGDSVAVEIITPETNLSVAERFNNVFPLLARQQAQVSQLYARNNDVLFSAPVATSIAA